MNLLSNTKWVAFSQGVKVLVQLLNMVVLARILPPEEYGLMAMALVVINLAMLVRDLGTSAAIIQRNELSDRTINAVFWLNMYMGIGICFSMVFLSPYISVFFGEKKLQFILLLLAFSFPLGSSSATHLALLERKSEFKKVARIEVVSSLLSFFVAVTMAVMGFGVLSLVFQIIVLNLLSTLQLWIASKWRPSINKIWDKDELKGILGFSANLTGFNLINYFSRNSDVVIIGHFMSSVILGSYSLAYRIMLFPLQSLTFVITRSLFPILSRNQENSCEIKRVYCNVFYYILFIVMPLMLGLAFLSKEFVSIVFGNKWMLSADILFWLAPTAIIQSVLSVSGTIFMSKGRTNILMVLGVVGAFFQVSAFLLGVKFDIIIFSKFYFIANVLNFFSVMFSVHSLIKFSVRELFFKILPVILSSFIMLMGLFFYKLYLIIHVSNVFYFYSSILAGALMYGVSVSFVDGNIRRVIYNFIILNFKKT
ncbi:lipopolysaccharide biosynthesis protein [Pectobacterium carotovorum]|uniref:lipopolysaccharide biosynthesis protein n=1 Tax=Pectobacterium carotovorum TaxID=554 RepID=UPI001CF1E20D|nr:lipopolysaccharide biosynthesis protein [Pectobacterium carotovorum]MCA6975819.1 lipopolysaccharide biosynthesis protein [Pectobacterium carotovorum]